MPATPGATEIGFIGLGIMGAPMARNLLRAGYGLKVHSRSDRPPGLEVMRAGGRRVGTPREAAAGSDVVITVVTDTADVEQVILGPDGVIEGARPGAVVIDMSTIAPSATRRLAARLRERGVRLLDAPVSGGDVGAREGTLAIMVGGDRADFEHCLPVLQALGRSVHHLGDHGAGQTAKLCNQVAGSLANLAMAEALMLAAACRLDVGKVLEAISGGAAGSWHLSNLGPRILAGDFAPGFTVRLQQKDLKLVLELAREAQLALPGVSLVHQLFNIVERHGGGGEGTQALIKAYEAQARIEARAG